MRSETLTCKVGEKLSHKLIVTNNAGGKLTYATTTPNAAISDKGVLTYQANNDGTFTINITVTDDKGNSATAIITLSVSKAVVSSSTPSSSTSSGTTKKQFSITFDATIKGQIETTDKKTISFTEGDEITAPTVTPQKGWKFTGWSPTLSATATADATYVAQYEVDTTTQLTITFDAGANGKIEEAQTKVIKYSYGDAIAPPTVTPNEGYTNPTWSPAIPATATADATFTAQYTATP